MIEAYFAYVHVMWSIAFFGTKSDCWSPWALVAMATTTDIYEPRASVKERFPDKEDGLELVEAIFDLYSISRSGELQFYDSSMRNKLVIPHELNSRDQHQVLRKYATKLQ